jgi:hypothetical protein
MRILLACFAILLAPLSAKADDIRQKYVGQSGCAPEFKKSANDYGIRLAKNQRARLEAHVFQSKAILVIVQHSNDTDKCGIVRDAIKSQATDRSFVWDCVDKLNPSEVVVGTWPSKHQSVSGPAIKAWRIDLKQLKFLRLNVPVVCDAGNYAGSDEGGDLATWSRKRVAN